MKAAIGWVRDSNGRVTKRTVKDISNAITTFAGRGITGSDGLCSTKPYVLEIYGCCISPNFGEDKELLEFILAHVKIVKASKKSKPDGTVVFTGFRNPKLEKFLLEHFNLEVRDSLTKDVTIVLALDKNAKSSKLEKARKYNFPIYDLHEACEKFGYIE